ncbi:hypothetical protein KC571_02045 [candidate division WWE3 bacterium]|uniref:Uncharacterized protein n=1 Tax=candidate division WWE3 bacterium TaxID=2053526 RepID=A0A955RQ61_UNCKA|nr:hypothetical protein [candidate division WWE3 bacterium]
MSTNVAEAKVVISNRQHSSMILTTEFADAVNLVARHFPDDMSVNDLYWGCSLKDSRAGQAWLDFILSLKPHHVRGTITRTLSGLCKFTVGDVRDATVDQLDGLWKVRTITASFWIYALRRAEQE